MYMLRQNVDCLRKLSIELQLVGIAHDSSCLLDPVQGIKHDILVGASVNANKYSIAPSGPLTGDTSLLGSALVPDLFTKERQSQLVLSAPNPMVSRHAVLANNSGQSDKRGVLDEPRYEGMRHWHMPLHESVQRQVHGPYLALEVSH